VVTLDVHPRTAQVTLVTQLPGLALTVDGKSVSGPDVFTAVVGAECDVGAQDQQRGGRGYRFDAWRDGLPATHGITTSEVGVGYDSRGDSEGRFKLRFSWPLRVATWMHLRHSEPFVCPPIWNAQGAWPSCACSLS
jgi:hypothetical protein